MSFAVQEYPPMESLVMVVNRREQRLNIWMVWCGAELWWVQWKDPWTLHLMETGGGGGLHWSDTEMRAVSSSVRNSFKVWQQRDSNKMIGFNWKNICPVSADWLGSGNSIYRGSMKIIFLIGLSLSFIYMPQTAKSSACFKQSILYKSVSKELKSLVLNSGKMW